MRLHKVMAVAIVVVLVFIAGTALGQDTIATIRTYQGVSYKLGDPSLEVFYTIGEPKSMQAGAPQAAGGQSFGSMINITNVSGAPAGGEQPGAGGGTEERLLRGHYQANAITVSNQGVPTRILLDQIRAVRFTRRSVAVEGLQLPPYIPYYKYSVSVSLVGGGQVDADYVNLGATIIRGTAPNGRVDILWEEVEQILFER